MKFRCVSAFVSIMSLGLSFGDLSLASMVIVERPKSAVDSVYNVEVVTFIQELNSDRPPTLIVYFNDGNDKIELDVSGLGGYRDILEFKDHLLDRNSDLSVILGVQKNSRLAQKSKYYLKRIERNF